MHRSHIKKRIKGVARTPRVTLTNRGGVTNIKEVHLNLIKRRNENGTKTPTTSCHDNRR
jgi:hypothetical protein